MKTVLSIIDWYLPGYRAGGTLKAFSNQVSHFNEEYEFKIITRNTDYMETTPYKNIESNSWIEIGKNTSAFYLSADNINYNFLKKLFSETYYDTVYIHGIYSLWFSILPIFLAKKNNATKIVISAHGMFGEHAISVKSSKKKLFAHVSKILGLYNNVYFHAANIDESKDIIKAVGAKAKVIIAEEMPMNMELESWQPRVKNKGDLLMASVGRIAAEKNTLYAIQCLEKCTTGNIVYDIYGPVYDQEYWQKCENIIAKLPSNVKVNYQGSLPGDQVLEKLKTYHIMLLPTTGENFGHTILESFMASTPVLISNNTPWKQLESKKIGWDLPLDNMNVFSDVITKAVNMNQDSFDVLSKKALQFADKFIHDDKIKKENDMLFNPDKHI